MSPGESYDIHPPSTTLPVQLQLTFLRFQLYQVTLLIAPLQHCHNNYSLHFSYFQLYQVTLPIDPPTLQHCQDNYS